MASNGNFNQTNPLYTEHFSNRVRQPPAFRDPRTYAMGAQEMHAAPRGAWTMGGFDPTLVTQRCLYGNAVSQAGTAGYSMPWDTRGTLPETAPFIYWYE